jgi:protein-disulfide isomerase
MPNKRPIVLAALIVLLFGLMYGITQLNNASRAGSQISEPYRRGVPPPALFPKPDIVAKRWPEIVSHAAAPPRGNPTAPYTIAEFGDFQCPLCGKVRPMIEKLLAQYPDQVNLIFIQRPLPTVHHWAVPAAEASEVAAEQGKFWPMYDALYSHQDDLEPGFYPDYAAKIGIGNAQFDAALKTTGAQQSVKRDADFSDNLGVMETPTLILHDNVHGTAIVYTGLKGDQHPGSPPGITTLVASPPWRTTTKQAASAAQ